MSSALFVFLACFALSAFGQAEYNTIADGDDARLMMRGKDPVSYFQGEQPVLGKRELKAGHDGVTYRFASEENRKLFLANPEKYVPMYGGHCSNGMSYAIGKEIRGQTTKVLASRAAGARSASFLPADRVPRRGRP